MSNPDDFEAVEIHEDGSMTICTCFTEEEYAQVVAAADKAGMSADDFLTQLLIDEVCSSA